MRVGILMVTGLGVVGLAAWLLWPPRPATGPAGPVAATPPAPSAVAEAAKPIGPPGQGDRYDLAGVIPPPDQRGGLDELTIKSLAGLDELLKTLQEQAWPVRVRVLSQKPAGPGAQELTL